MFAYIDESGTFIPTGNGQQSVSLVGAIVIPAYLKSEVFKKFKSIKSELGYSKKEIKGNFLNLDQICYVIENILKYDIFYHFIPTDLSYTNNIDVVSHKEEQCRKLIESIHQNSTNVTISFFNDVSKRLSLLSPQLYIQFHLNIKLLVDIIRYGTLYYVQRNPKELESFYFLLDPKDIKRTEYEKIWLELFLPIAQMRVLKKPIMFLTGCDYSYFQKEFFQTVDQFPSYLKDYYGLNPVPSINANKLFDKIDFIQSQRSNGLQLVDILVNSTKRVLTGRANDNLINCLKRIIIQHEHDKLYFTTFGDELKAHEKTIKFGKCIAKNNKPMRI
jgi:hypothetical protein